MVTPDDSLWWLLVDRVHYMPQRVMDLAMQFQRNCCSFAKWCPTLWDTPRLPCPSPSPWVHSNSCPLSHWCHPTISSSVVLFSSCPQSFQASGSFLISQLFASGSQSFSFNISPSYEYSGLIPFRIDWFDLLAVQGTLRSFLQHHSSKASIPWCSAFFMVQLSRPYTTTGKTITLTIHTFVGKVMSLL